MEKFSDAQEKAIPGGENSQRKVWGCKRMEGAGPCRSFRLAGMEGVQGNCLKPCRRSGQGSNSQTPCGGAWTLPEGHGELSVA